MTPGEQLEAIIEDLKSLVEDLDRLTDVAMVDTAIMELRHLSRKINQSD